MIYLILGLILLVFPFILLSLFSDKKRGFIYIFCFLFLFHTTLAVLAQFFLVFYYGLVVFFTLLADIIVLLVYLKKKNKLSFEIKKIDWFVVLVVFIAFLTLFQIHYNYTGEITTVLDGVKSYHKVENMKYVYPYLSDEWYAVSLISNSIDSHSLPLTNPLSGLPFSNLEMFFHSFLAEIMLILGLNPLLYYSIVGIVFNTLIIVLAYIFLRINNIPKLASSICALSILYITTSANLPGIWHFIPISLGIVFCLLCLSFLSIDKFKMAILSFLLLCLFYPPLAPFLGLALLAYSKNLKKVGLVLVAIAVATFLVAVILLKSPLSGILKYGFSRLYFLSFTGYNFAQFKFYYIIPFFVIVLAILGLAFVFKNKKWLLSQIVLGVLLWAYYSFSINRFVIDHEKVIFYTSIISSLVAGFGLFEVEKYLSLKFKEKGEKFLKYIEILAIVVFVVLIPFYTQRQVWKKIVFVNADTKQVLYPRSPINNYLTQDDLEIFKGIKNKRFLSISWKGLTIGTATKNYPAVAKEGTISVGSDRIINNFYQANCENKKSMAKTLNLDYIYLYKFNCPGFEKIQESNEGFLLYKVNN